MLWETSFLRIKTTRLWREWVVCAYQNAYDRGRESRSATSHVRPSACPYLVHTSSWPHTIFLCRPCKCVPPPSCIHTRTQTYVYILTTLNGGPGINLHAVRVCVCVYVMCTCPCESAYTFCVRVSTSVWFSVHLCVCNDGHNII
jgi:hypothetical protein